MNNKIFISYNHNDQSLIDTIARRMNIEFGQNNIFYDAWSIQPGDSIIGKMNEGLETFATFFFFVSPNSLNSKMVSLEWQTALNRAINNDLKFVAVKIDDCEIPAILSNMLYIDLFGEGLDDAIEKMKCVVKAENNYKPLENIQNLISTIEEVDIKTLRITVKATTYAETNPILAFACENSFEDFSVCFNVSDGFTQSGKDELKVDDSLKLNARTVQMQRVLKPGFPFVFEVYLEKDNPLENIATYILKDAETRVYQQIPIS